MKHHGISWEEAVESVINDPPENRNKEIVYHGKKYKSKKNLFKVLFPNKRYESISASISILMNNESLSFEDAISRYKEKGKPSNIKKEIDYNGKHYHSLREACKELGLKPESVSYYAKHSFRNNYSKAIDYLLHQNEN